MENLAFGAGLANPWGITFIFIVFAIAGVALLYRNRKKK
jgi:cbb3-type cytochrome oxidase subunit 3